MFSPGILISFYKLTSPGVLAMDWRSVHHVSFVPVVDVKEKQVKTKDELVLWFKSLTSCSFLSSWIGSVSVCSSDFDQCYVGLAPGVSCLCSGDGPDR